jgi:hypothetical protein
MELFSLILSKAIFAMINWNNLRLCSERLDSKTLTYKVTDLLFEATINDCPVNLCLMLEHQSTVDLLMARRFWGNIELLWQRYEQDEPKKKRYPLVLPMVISNAERKWTAPKDMGDLLEGIGQMKGVLGRQRPRLVYNVLDLYGMTDKHIKKLAVSATVRIFLLALRRPRNIDLASAVEGWHDLLKEAWKEPGGQETLEIWLNYLDATEGKITENVMKSIGKATGTDWDPTKTLAWKWMKEGFDKGLVEGHAKGHTEGLAKGHTEGLAKGHTEGLAKGRIEGRVEGHLEGLAEGEAATRRILLRQLRKRFGEPSVLTLNLVNLGKLHDLETWTECLETAQNIDEVFARQ